MTDRSLETNNDNGQEGPTKPAVSDDAVSPSANYRIYQEDASPSSGQRDSAQSDYTRQGSGGAPQSPSATSFYPHYQSGSSQSAPVGSPTSSWETYYTEAGKPYFYNTTTGITQWEKPQELQQPLNNKSDAPVLPACQPLGTDPGKSGPAGANLFM